MRNLILPFMIIGLILIISGCGRETPMSSDLTRGKTEQTTFLAKTVQRSIDEFVDAQGTFCFPPIFNPPGSAVIDGCLIFVPPIQNHFGASDPANTLLASVDYAGLSDDWIKGQGHPGFGTKTLGTVTEKSQPDGTAEIKVVLKTSNALMWVADGSQGVGGFNGDLVFGHRAPDIFAGAVPALGNSVFKVTFLVSEPGLPLPDLQDFAVLGFLQFSLVASSDGELAAGGTANLSIVQQGLFNINGRGATTDGFPVEFIKLNPTGN